MRCLEALGRWSELEETGYSALLLSDQQNTSIISSVRHSSGSTNTSTSSTVRSGCLNLTLSEAKKRQKIAQMTARASCALGFFNFFL